MLLPYLWKTFLFSKRKVSLTIKLIADFTYILRITHHSSHYTSYQTVIIFRLILAIKEVPCPNGVKTFSKGPLSNTYYACESGKQLAVLKKCPDGQVYWPVRKSCFSRLNSEFTQTTDLQQYDRPVLGDEVFLGDFFDSNSGKVRNGFSLWKSTTVSEMKKARKSQTSTVDIYPTRSTLDRMQREDFSTNVQLDVMGKLVLGLACLSRRYA